MTKLVFELAIKSWRSRKLTVVLSVISITLSVVLFLSIEQINRNVKDSFASSISDIDLIVAARNSPFSILSATVLDMGFLRNQIDYRSFEYFSKNKYVKKSIPFSLGDNHKGFRVIGTSNDFFDNNYRKKSKLFFSEINIPNIKNRFVKNFNVVIGSKVAKQLNYKRNQKIVLAHGLHKDSAYVHDNLKFTIVGILQPTYSSVDSSIYISLNAIEAIHHGWDNGAPPIEDIEIKQNQKFHIDKISGFYVYLKNRTTILRLKYQINKSKLEPLTAVLPLYEMSRLWKQLGTVEKSLKIISLLILLIALLALLINSFSTLQYRKNEMTILRSIGASPKHIFFLFLVENMLVALSSLVIAFSLVFFFIQIFSGQISQLINLPFNYKVISKSEILYISIYFAVSLLASSLPAASAFKQALIEKLK